MFQGIDFVVDDDFMDAAYDTLPGAGFKKCKSEVCIGNKKLSYAPTPYTHLHITLASDPNQLPGPDSLGRRGRFQQDLHPVRVPIVYWLLQALLLLVKKDQNTYGGYWMNWVSYILEFCIANGVFDKSRLTGNYKTHVDAFLEGNHTLREEAFECIGLTE